MNSTPMVSLNPYSGGRYILRQQAISKGKFKDISLNPYSGGRYILSVVGIHLKVAKQ